jgi:ABC-2 type transport system permease protein
MNTMTMLVKREFWEHRSLWIAPLIWVGIITLMFMWVVFVAIPHEVGDHGSFGDHMSGAPGSAELSGLSDEDRRDIEEAIKEGGHHDGMGHDGGQSIYALSHFALTGFVTTFAIVVVFFYLIDCLYTERRDRSILFWKSLPVSDAQVVLSKLLVAMIVVPLGAVILAAVMQLFMTFIVWLRFHGNAIGAVMPDWSMLAWFKAQMGILAVVLAGLLWYAPIAGFLLLMSSWARRNVFLWTVLPPVALVALEGFFFHSTKVLQFIGWRFSGYFREVLHVGKGDGGMPRPDELLARIDLAGFFLQAEVWIGLIVAAGLVFAAIRVRRYRDES